ncbi:MAG: phosphopantetheine-binding protein, partial [bacterium]|nr:phosphopantetheine-binding protein [bacterium]
SGKIDRKALPQPDDLKLATDATYVKPRTEIEQNIAAIWQDVLRLEKVGVYDNFFDLGGHSLAMAKVHNQLCEQLKQDISIVDLFKYPTIYSLSQYFAAEKEKQPIFIEKQQRALQQRKAMDVQRERLAKRRAIK